MRKSWSKQEDQKLIDYINIHGEGSWTSLPKAAGLQRRGKSCRLRWMKYLRPPEDNFRPDEEDLIIKLHALLGNRWSLIAGRLPGRTEKEVKKYWNSHMKRKLVSMSIDPNNHRLNQKLSPSSGHLKDTKSKADSADSVNGDDAAVITSPNVPIPFRPTSSFSPSLQMLAVRRS